MRGRQSPTLDLLVVFLAVFIVEVVGDLVGVSLAWFALAAPMAQPWTLVTSVYAHAGLGHLVANALALAVVGFGLERFTTRWRFHAFFLLTGAVAGLVHLLATDLVGQAVAVLGASGAVLALYGYVLASNRLTGGVLSRLGLGRRWKVALVIVLALAVTWVTSGPGVAPVAHFTGFAVGLVAGRYRVLATAATG